MTHAFAQLVERELAAWRRDLAGLHGARDVAMATAVLAEVLDPADPEERFRQLALWELYLQAGRDPMLRSIAEAWSDGCTAITAELLQDLAVPPEAARLLMLALEGVLLHNLVEQRTDSRAFTAQAVRTLLDAARR